MKTQGVAGSVQAVGSVRSSNEAGNDRGAKGRRAECRGKQEQQAVSLRTDDMETKLCHITELVKASKEAKVFNVMHLLGEVSNLTQFFALLKRGKAPGVDKMTAEMYEADLERNLQDLVTRMKRWSYRPQPARRVYIKKANGKMRPLGIPALEDKVVQMGVHRILEAVYEPDFLDCSYGFRPGRNCHQAIAALHKMVREKPVNFMIDADIKGFFDNVSHEWMLKFLSHRIKDKKLLRLVRRILLSGVEEDGRVTPTMKGTPQGGIVSPLLANLYLHYVLDLWVEKRVKRECRGFVGMVRYADDFVIAVEYEDEAKAIMGRLKERLAQFALELSEEKTRIVRFGRHAGKGESFSFLGFTHYNAKTRRGEYKVGCKTDGKRFTRSLKDLSEWVKKMRTVPMGEWWGLLGSKLEGHFHYYGVSGNSLGIQRYFFLAVKMVLKWLNRRSQRTSFTWDSFSDYLKRFPLPRPRIRHNLYALVP